MHRFPHPAVRWNTSRFHSILPLAVLISLAATAAARANPAAAEFDTRTFRPVDTELLMGSPEPLPPLVIEKAFPALDFGRPVAIAHAGDGTNRLFVCDQPGIIWVFENRRDVAEKRVFLDIRDKVLTEHFEEGLLGLAFHPEYEDNGRFFIYYSTRPRSSMVAELRVSEDDPNRADPSSEREILRVTQPYGNHNGGGIEFGPDGMLYIPLGDGGAANDPHGNAQDLSVLLGKILRIDVDRKDPGKNYAIPPDNPLAGDRGKEHGDDVRGEIWVWGVRNPWRMTFDRETGQGWFGDVGQNLYEEIDLLKKGANYGWKVREGLHPFAPDAERTGDSFVDPVWEYPRHDGKSITGGLVYRGEALPELTGAYLYADFVTFNIWRLRLDEQNRPDNLLISRSTLPVAAFGEDEQGEVYIAAFDAAPGTDMHKLPAGRLYNLDRGSLYRFRHAPEVAIDPEAFPRKLSETRLFADTKTHTVAAGAVPYDVSVPLWSDGARKERYVALPQKGTIRFDARRQFVFPVGTVLIKTFHLDQGGERGERRLETRLLVRSSRGWDGYTYVWNEEQTDAELIDSALRRTYTVVRGGTETEQEWYFPSRSDCNACHTEVAGHVLGLNARQLNHSLDYGDASANQIEVWRRLGLFENPPGEPPQALDAYPHWDDPDAATGKLARAYLDVNCAICHAPGGTGGSRADLQYYRDLGRMSLVGRDPGQRRLGGPESKLVVPGEPHQSELLLRMMHAGDARMPPLASSRVDWQAVGVIGEWIETLEGRR